MGIAKRYFNSIVKVFCATCIMGFGIALFIACELGSDPVTVFLDGFHRKTGIAVSVTDEVLNLIILTLALLCNRKKAGICTIVCVLISGFCVQIPTTLIEPLHLANRSILVRLIGLGIGQVCLAIAYAWTQTFNDGINALDCVFFKVIDKTHVKYHTIRILYDGTFITIGFLLGGIVGVGTIISLATTGILVEILKNRMDTIIKWKENYSEGKVKNMDEKIVQNAMSIILNAGDARVACKEALDAIAAFDLESAEEKMKDAQKKITAAHKVQTDAIQGETRGEKSEYSLLFAHAQDTLMTVYSEINIAKQMIKIFESYEKRISNLEKK